MIFLIFEFFLFYTIEPARFEYWDSIQFYREIRNKDKYKI